MEGGPQNRKQCLGSEHTTSLIRTSCRPFRRENPTGFLQRAEVFLNPFGLCASSADWRITSIDWRTLPSSSLNHRIRKVGVRPRLGFCFFPILKAEMGFSSLINCASHHHQNLHGSPSAKSGELCSTPRKVPSPGLQTVRETLLSLHLCWAFPPNPKVMMQVLFSSWICLAGSGSYLSLFPLHFTCGFKCTVAKILFHTEETRQYF